MNHWVIVLFGGGFVVAVNVIINRHRIVTIQWTVAGVRKVIAGMWIMFRNLSGHAAKQQFEKRSHFNPDQFMKQNPPHRVCLSARQALHFEKGTLERDRRGMLQCVAAMAMALLLWGCGNGTSNTGTFSAEYRASQIVSGREQEIELTLTVHYRLPANPKTAVTVDYRVQVNAPEGWRVTPDQWGFSHTLMTSEIGFNETRKLALLIPVGAAPGPHSLQLVITPTSGPAQSVDLVLQVVAPGK